MKIKIKIIITSLLYALITFTQPAFSADIAQIISPEADSVITGDVLIKWSKVRTASSYQVEILDKTNNDAVLFSSQVLSKRKSQTTVNINTSTPLAIRLYTLLITGKKKSQIIDRSLYHEVDYNPDSATLPIVAPTTLPTVAPTLSSGFDWRLPDYATSEPSGGLIRNTWETDRDYTNTAFYSIHWDAVYQADGSYNFSAFTDWLTQYNNGDNALVRLEAYSRCDVPVALRDKFNYYAAGSIAFWESAYIDELSLFLNAFAAEFATNPKIVGIHLGFADGEYQGVEYSQYVNADGKDSCDTVNYYSDDIGWGEIFMTEPELEHAMSTGFSSEIYVSAAKQVIDTYLAAFSAVKHKLAMTNIEDFIYDSPSTKQVDSAEIKIFNDLHTQEIVPYVKEAGIGNRDGLVEDWNSPIFPAYGFNVKANADGVCSMVMDETFAESLGTRYWGTENEEYGTEAWLVDRYGPTETYPYRFLVSSLRALQMRRNHMSIHPDGMDKLAETNHNLAAFLPYLANTLGRTRIDTPDVFTLLGERYVNRSKMSAFDENRFTSTEGTTCIVNHPEGDYVKFRGFGRWLTEIDNLGTPSNPIALTLAKSPWSIPQHLPSIEGDITKYEYTAKKATQFSFDIDDTVVDNRCGETCSVEVKVVLEDTLATTVSLETSSGVIEAQTTGDGTVKTVTFTVQSGFTNSVSGADFSIKMPTESERLPVLMTRVNFLQQ